MNKEIWQPIPFALGYEISSNGNVRNKYGRMLTPEKTGKGYLRVPMIVNGKKKNFKIHRLVATVFLGIPSDGIIRHKDGVRTNNNVANLEYALQPQRERLPRKWEAIPNYEGIYEISNYGEIKSLNRKVVRNDGVILILKEKILKQQLSKFGYYVITLHKECERKTEFVHRLVAGVFVKNPNGYIEVNHKNGNKKDNRVSNLEWCTRQQNVNHSIRTGLRQIKGTPYHFRKIKKLDTKGNLLKVYDTVADAARENNLNKTNITQAARGVTKTSGGYCWEYGEKYNIHDKLKPKVIFPIAVTTPNGETINFPSVAAAGRYLGVSRLTVWNAYTGAFNSRLLKGYTFSLITKSQTIGEQQE